MLSVPTPMARPATLERLTPQVQLTEHDAAGLRLNARYARARTILCVLRVYRRYSCGWLPESWPSALS
jgi:hypothetical protein